jgi:transcriptional regulator with GAF, ATPase, and Fis domain
VPGLLWNVRYRSWKERNVGVDENEFFRQATLRICSSLDIETALERCFDYIRPFIPAFRMGLHILDVDLNVLRLVAAVGGDLSEWHGKVLPLPEKGQDARAAFFEADGPLVRIMNRPDSRLGMEEVRKRLGLHADISVLGMALKLEGNRIGDLALIAEGLDQYTEEHARLLSLLHEPFAMAMSNALKHTEVIRFKEMLADDNRYLRGQLREMTGDQIVGADFGLNSVMTLVEQVAPLDSAVLLLGETGVGKEVIANAIHSLSTRRDGPFIKVNCGAIPETLLDSELFGHEKGAFTGALGQKRGRFERADKGTIFLDEIGELPPQAQVRLLHVLQSREIERVGGTAPIPVDIRVISATHRNLEAMVASGRFREDLWFRLNVFPIMIPPLRQRKEDIPALVDYFIEVKSMELKVAERPALAPGAVERLVAYDWPGNVRELANVIERALIRDRGGRLSFETLLPLPVSGDSDKGRTGDPAQPVLPLGDINARHIRWALERARGKINGPGGAAEMLAIHPNTLRKRMNKLRIPYGRKSWQPG